MWNVINAIALCFVFFLAVPCSILDLSSPARDRTCAPCSRSTESQSLGHQGGPCDCHSHYYVASLWKSLQNVPSLHALRAISSLEPHTMWLNEWKAYTLQFPASSWNHHLFSTRVAVNSSVGESQAFSSPLCCHGNQRPGNLAWKQEHCFFLSPTQRKDWNNFRAGGDLHVDSTSFRKGTATQRMPTGEISTRKQES